MVKTAVIRATGVVAGVSVCFWLSGCGGGGDSGGTSNPTAPADTTDYAAAFDSTPPDSVTEAATMSFMASRSTADHDATTQASADFTVTPNASGYAIQFNSGSVMGSTFFSDLVLESAQFQLNRTNRVLQGFKTTQFEGSIGLPGNPARAYASSIQLLTDSGVGRVGIGQWKFLGTDQSGYYSGTKHAHGAFVIGTPVAPSLVPSIPSGSYGGYSQSGAEAVYLDIFDQVTANASVSFDAAKKSVTIRLSKFTYWNSYFGRNGQLSIAWDTPRAFHLLPDSLTCSGPVSTTTGSFTCEFAGTLHGTVTGKFYGATGQVVAGTFALKGSVIGSYNEGLVGGFMAQRAGSLSGVTSAGGSAIAVTPTSIQAADYVANPKLLTVHASVKNSLVQPFNVAVLDPAGQVNPNVYIAQTSPGEYDIQFATRSTQTVGTRSGELQLRICNDDPLICRKPVAGSPWKIPYQIVTQPYPGPDPQFAANTLTGLAYQGQSLLLSVPVSFSEPSVYGPYSSGEQYRYTVLDSGILDSTNPTGNWYNEMPSSFSANSLNFSLKSGLDVGLYQGVIKVSVCGFSYSAYTSCLPIENSLIQIPYQVDVRAWTDLRPLTIDPQIQALVNQRGSPKERRTFPLDIDAAQIDTRWKIPFGFDIYSTGVGQGIVYASAYGMDGSQTLNVYSENDGQLLWTRSFTSPTQGASIYGDGFAVYASNSRIFVRLGSRYNGFALKVFNARTGELVFEQACPNCENYWESVYGHGWAAQVFFPSTHFIGLWIYDERTDTLIKTTPRESSSSAFNSEETDKIREIFFSGVDFSAPALSPSVSSDCYPGKSSLPYPVLKQPIGRDFCYSPALDVTRWSIPYASLPTGQAAWPQFIEPLSAGSTVVHLTRLDIHS